MITLESVVEVGEFEITREQAKEITWPRWVGVGVVGAGVIVFLLGASRKK